MESNPTQIIHDFPPFFRVYNTGHVERYNTYILLPPSHDPKTNVVSRDVLISQKNSVSVRIFLPKNDAKLLLPLIIYIHGGGFSVESAFSSTYHNYTNSLASQSASIVVSIEYKLAPEHPIPACYDDCYEAIRWIDSHTRAGNGPDPWLHEYADFNKVFMAGDSAGANIVHNMAMRANEIEFSGLILVNPFFGNGKPDLLWEFICPDSAGANDLRLNPMADMDVLSKLGCQRVLVCVSEKDMLRDRGWHYYEALKKSEWKGRVELYETPGEDHVFHLFDPSCEHALLLMKRIVGFIKSGAHAMAHL